jgi:predicted PurR-regulated permease PerM
MATVEDSTQAVSARAARTETWLQRFLIVLTGLGLIALGGVVVLLIGLIAGPLSLFLLSALLAYILYPAVARLQRHISRFWAILLVFVAALALVSLVGLGIVLTLVNQLGALIDTLHRLPAAEVPGWLQGTGLTSSRLRTSAEQGTAALQAFEGTLLPLIGNAFEFALKSIIVAALLVYFLLYGPRMLAWIREEPPLRIQNSVTHFLDVVDQVMGGFLRGALFLACLMGALTGAGAFLMGIPYWLLIALIVFVSEFIPVI